MSITADPTARKIAQALGLKRYFTGKPCKHGHFSERAVSTRRCVTCSQEQDRLAYREHPEKSRLKAKKYLWKRIGCSEPTHPTPEACDMCGGPPTKRALHLDHDHDTKQFRGWLCHYCNIRLGQVGDNEEAILKWTPMALSYLRKEKTNVFAK